MPPPLERIDVDTVCVQTMSTQPQLVVYSGNQAYTIFQFGFAAVDAIDGFGYTRNGKGKSNPPFCGSPILFVGDCWQSVTRLASSPNFNKWIIAAGAPPTCTENGLAVWKWDAATKRAAWYGFINASIERSGPFMEVPKLDSDVAYAIEPNSGSGDKWTKFDLNAKTVIATGLATPVTPPIQSGIQGYTYTIHPIHPNPIPPQYPGPNKFYWQREGIVPPTPNPYAAWIEELYNEGITSGCSTSPLRYCPDAPVTRAEMAVFLLKVKHGSSYIPPPCTGIFEDVQCGS